MRAEQKKVHVIRKDQFGLLPPHSCTRHPVFHLPTNWWLLGKPVGNTVNFLKNWLSSFLRAMVREHYPKRSAISAQDILNLKVRLRLLYEEVQDKGDLAEYKISISTMFKGLDNEEDGIIDNASRHVHTILRSVMSSGTAS